MSASLISNPTDYCRDMNASGLRERRFSTNPQLSRPQGDLFGRSEAQNDSQNESAIEEDEEPQVPPMKIELPPNDFDPPTVLPSPLSSVHMSGYSTHAYIPRHQNGTSGPFPSPAVSPPATSTSFFANTPASEFPPSIPVDRSGSIIHLIGGEPVPNPAPSLERVKRRLTCAYFLFFLCGWGDGVTGTVLPYLQSYFHLSDMLISGLWCGGTVGFILGTFTVEPIMHSLGLYRVTGAANRSLRPSWTQKSNTSIASVAFSASQSRYLTLILSSVVHASFFVLMGIRRGFSAMFIAYAVSAWARALMTASLNEFLASGPKEAMGYAYGIWSLGGVFAPLVCQTIIASGAPWQNFYYGSLVVSAINLALVMYAFQPTQRELFTERKEALANSSSRSAPGTPAANESRTIPLSTLDSKTSPEKSSHGALSKPENTFMKALGMAYTWAFSLFGCLYYASDTIAQGYTVSYLLAARHADPKTAGYVTSGYAGGLTAGRLLWGYFSPKLTFTQQKHAITGLMYVFGIALVLHITIWVVKSSLQNSIATAIIGFVYGPVWPGALTIISLLLPAEVRMMVMAIFSTAGNFGSSVGPLVIGAMSSVKGIQSMPYLAVPLTISFLTLWAMFPSRVPSRFTLN